MVISPENLDILNQLPDPLLVKDLDLAYLAASDDMVETFGFQHRDDMLGHTVFDIRCPAVESADKFFAQDQQVLATGESVDTLDIHTFAHNEIKMLLGKRAPWYHTDNSLGGALYQGKYLSHALAQDVCERLISLDQRYYPKRKRSRGYQVSKSEDANQLSKREAEVLFYVLRGKSAKEMARILDLSYRTVEFYTSRLKKRLGVTTRSSLIEKAISQGLIAMVPLSLLPPGVSCVLDGDSKIHKS